MALRPRLLLTRPLQDSQRLAKQLPEYDTLIAPVLKIAYVEHDAAKLARAPGLVFTSAHAIAAAGPGAGRLAICVGPRTAAIAERAGFTVRQGDGTAESLSRLVAASEVPLLYPHGRHIAKCLPIEGMIVYDQIAQPLSTEAKQFLRGGESVVLPVFSVRTARILSFEIPCAPSPIILVALSQQIADAFQRQVSERIVAKTPDFCGLIARLREIAARN